MRAIWSGSIGFGLVSIPIKLYSAVQPSELNLDLLDKKDFAPIHFKRINAETGKEVGWQQIVKAYNYEGNYVALTDDDFKKASPEKSQTIELFQFVKAEEIDSIYYETPYYTEPEKSGTKPYALLREALKKVELAGLASFVLRNKEHLAILKPYKNILLLQTIRFEEEIRNTDELNIPAQSSVKPAELKMALTLIEQMTAPFNISKYKDTYSAELLKIIHAKVKGKKPRMPKLKVAHKKPATDLMSQLKASLEAKAKKKTAS